MMKDAWKDNIPWMAINELVVPPLLSFRERFLQELLLPQLNTECIELVFDPMC